MPKKWTKIILISVNTIIDMLSNMSLWNYAVCLVGLERCGIFEADCKELND